MKYALWIVQVLLALVFLATSAMKLLMPIDQLAANMEWVNAVPELLVRFIGLAEVAGALGLILPAATRVQPQLTPLAAAGLALIMVLAAIFHLSRGEAPLVIANAVLFALAAFVAYGRWKWAPIAPRNTTANRATSGA
jgi:putative oxidoreductase